MHLFCYKVSKLYLNLFSICSLFFLWLTIWFHWSSNHLFPISHTFWLINWEDFQKDLRCLKQLWDNQRVNLSTKVAAQPRLKTSQNNSSLKKIIVIHTNTSSYTFTLWILPYTVISVKLFEIQRSCCLMWNWQVKVLPVNRSKMFQVWVV